MSCVAVINSGEVVVAGSKRESGGRLALLVQREPRERLALVAHCNGAGSRQPVGARDCDTESGVGMAIVVSGIDAKASLAGLLLYRTRGGRHGRNHCKGNTECCNPKRPQTAANAFSEKVLPKTSN
jgi:hypothetical protein